MLLIYTILYLISTITYYLKHNYIASVIMVGLAIFLYIEEARIDKRIINIRGLFALGFIGGFGISLLKLSKLSDEYSAITFLAVFISYFSLYLGAFYANRKVSKSDKKVEKAKAISVGLSIQQKLIIILIVITFMSFLIEVAILKFIPLFTIATPHAYSTFHVFMLHYLTTFYSFIPPISLCNYFIEPKDKKNKTLTKISFLYMIFMSLLLISRSKLILSIVLSVFVVITYKYKDIKNILTKRKNNTLILVAIMLFVILYVIITISRAHDIEYLNGIFEMKNDDIPIFISQPYMYIAHNFENLNYMINNIFRFTLGRRMLYPLFTITLIKKFFPIVVDAPYYIIKPELSTVTTIYDFYYDFGLIGVLIFCFLIGYLGKKLENKAYILVDKGDKVNNNYLIVLYAYYCYFMIFSFFQTYFSLTDTWVYMALIYILSKFIKMEKRK